MSMRMRVLCRAPSPPELSCKHAKSRLTLSGTTCLKTVYVYVHWVLIQAVPFALFIDLSRLQLDSSKGIICPKTEHEPQRRRANGAPNSSHTSPIAPTATCCSCLLWFFVLLFPHDENCAFIFATHASVRLFSSCVSLVCAVQVNGRVGIVFRP